MWVTVLAAWLIGLSAFPQKPISKAKRLNIRTAIYLCTYRRSAPLAYKHSTPDKQQNTVHRQKKI